MINTTPAKPTQPNNKLWISDYEHKFNKVFVLICFCWRVKQPAVREHSGTRAVLCSKHNSFRMAQRLLKGWMLNASVPHSNKQREIVTDKPMIQMKVCVKKGSVLIPAGDFGLLSFLCLHVHFSHVKWTSRQIKCSVSLSHWEGINSALLLPLWREDLRGMKSTRTVRLVRAQPALSLQQRSEGAGTFSMTPATQRGW